MLDKLLSMVAYAMIAALISQMWFPAIIMNNFMYTFIAFIVAGLVVGFFFPIRGLYAAIIIGAILFFNVYSYYK
jgi:hypothetical protein